MLCFRCCRPKTQMAKRKADSEIKRESDSLPPPPAYEDLPDAEKKQKVEIKVDPVKRYFGIATIYHPKMPSPAGAGISTKEIYPNLLDCVYQIQSGCLKEFWNNAGIKDKNPTAYGYLEDASVSDRLNTVHQMIEGGALGGGRYQCHQQYFEFVGDKVVALANGNWGLIRSNVTGDTLVLL